MDDKVKYIDGEIYIREDFYDDDRIRSLLNEPDGAEAITMYFMLLPFLEDGIGLDNAIDHLHSRFKSLLGILSKISLLYDHWLIGIYKIDGQWRITNLGDGIDSMYRNVK